MSLIWAGLVFISMGSPIIFGVLTLFEEENFLQVNTTSCSHGANNKNVVTCSLFRLFYVIYLTAKRGQVNFQWQFSWSIVSHFNRSRQWNGLHVFFILKQFQLPIIFLIYHILKNDQFNFTLIFFMLKQFQQMISLIN